MKRMIARACFLSSATIMMVPNSPGPSSGRQSLKHARNTAIKRGCSFCRHVFRIPARPHAVGCVGGVVRPVCLV